MSSLDRLAAEIAERGVGHAFGVTGSGPTLVLADALERRGMDVVRTYFEGNAAIMAGTIGRLTGRAGVAFCIKGPGLANLVPGLAACWFEQYPLVALTEAYPPGSPPEKAHKRIDHRTLTAAVAKGRRVLGTDGPTFHDLATWAEDETPGPVVLELTGVEAKQGAAAFPAANRRPASTTAMALVRKAQRPVVIAGTLAVRMGLSPALNRLRIPVFSTAAAKGVMDETLPHAAGVFTGVGLELAPERRILAEADLVIGIGLRPGEVLATQPFPCSAMTVEPLPEVPGLDAFRFADVAGATQIADILEALQGREWGGELIGECLARLDAQLLSGPFLPAHAFKVLAAHRQGPLRLVMDTGYFCTIGEHVWKARQAEHCLLSGQGRYMGIALPMAIGAAIYDPAVPTVVVVGDGGIGSAVSELRIAVERKLPLLVVLMTDGRFGSIRTRALKDKLSETALTIRSPSWLDGMNSLGLPASKAENPSALTDALQRWRPQDGPAFIEIPFSPDPYELMVRGIR